jgi:hypothetical protein
MSAAERISGRSREVGLASGTPRWVLFLADSTWKRMRRDVAGVAGRFLSDHPHRDKQIEIRLENRISKQYVRHRSSTGSRDLAQLTRGGHGAGATARRLFGRPLNVVRELHPRFGCLEERDARIRRVLGKRDCCLGPRTAAGRNLDLAQSSPGFAFGRSKICANRFDHWWPH